MITLLIITDKVICHSLIILLQKDYGEIQDIGFCENLWDDQPAR